MLNLQSQRYLAHEIVLILYNSWCYAPHKIHTPFRDEKEYWSKARIYSKFTITDAYIHISNEFQHISLETQQALDNINTLIIHIRRNFFIDKNYWFQYPEILENMLAGEAPDEFI